jgi:hypothetical protein
MIRGGKVAAKRTVKTGDADNVSAELAHRFRCPVDG